MDQLKRVFWELGSSAVTAFDWRLLLAIDTNSVQCCTLRLRTAAKKTTEVRRRKARTMTLQVIRWKSAEVDDRGEKRKEYTARISRKRLSSYTLKSRVRKDRWMKKRNLTKEWRKERKKERWEERGN